MGRADRTTGVLPRLLLAVAAVVLPLALVAAWVGAVATDTDHYVATVGPLADDPVVQDAVAARLERATVGALDAPPGAEAGVSEVVGAVVGEVVRSDAFAEAWREANRTAHVEVVALLEDGTSAGVVTRDGRVSIEVATLRDAIVDLLAQRGLEGVGGLDRLPELRASFPVARVDDLERAREVYAVVDAASLWLPVAWLALVVLALVVARGSAVAWRWLGAGSLVSALVLLAALPLARSAVVDRAPSASDEPVVGAVWDVVVADLRTAAVVVAVVSAVVLAGSVVGSLVGGRSRRGVSATAGTPRPTA